MRRTWLGVAAAVAASWLAGCETIDDRIARHEAFFRSLDPTSQAVVRSGEVRLGYDATMAYIALGDPDAVRRRIDGSGESVVWLYRNYYPVYDGTHFVGYRVYEVSKDGAQRLIQVPEFRDSYRYEAEEYLRLTFRDGVIEAIERTE